MLLGIYTQKKKRRKKAEPPPTKETWAKVLQPTWAKGEIPGAESGDLGPTGCYPNRTPCSCLFVRL